MKNIIEGLILLAREAIMSSRIALGGTESIMRVYGPLTNLQVALRGLLEVRPKEKELTHYLEHYLLDVTNKIKELRDTENVAGMFTYFVDWEERLIVIERNIVLRHIKKMK